MTGQARLSKSSELKKGISGAGQVFLVILWFATVLGGMMIAFPPAGRFSPKIGWALLAVAAIVFIATMDRWVKSFAGLILAAALRSCSTIFLGHLPENPDKKISAPNAVLITVFFVASAW